MLCLDWLSRALNDLTNLSLHKVVSFFSLQGGQGNPGEEGDIGPAVSSECFSPVFVSETSTVINMLY